MKKLISTIAIALCLALSTAAMAIDFNTATADELANDKTLMRMGPSTAQKVVMERDANGGFKDANDLMTRVSGIGQRFLEQNKDSLEFGEKVADPVTKPEEKKN